MPSATKEDFKPVSRNASALPAGHARDEQIKINTDVNAEKIEQAAETAGAINTDAFEPDPEILFMSDGLEVTHQQPGFIYAWKCYDSPASNKGYWVKQAQIQGWQLVCGDMKEAPECRDAAGMRRVGDTVLMRIPIARFEKLEKLQRDLDASRQSSVHSNLVELGKDMGVRVQVIGDKDVNPNTLAAISARTRGSMAADQKFEKAIREGSLRP